ncbi:MAG: Lrp/AsnC family transcriptional regulator [Steroidobacteraceae bacterium]
MKNNPPRRAGKLTRRMLDRLDLRILSALQENGRMSNKELADKVGLSASPCLVRVKRLEAAGLISRYIAIIELRKVIDSISVLALIYLRESDYKVARTLEEYLLNLPQLVELYDVNGECDYVARLVCRSTEDYSQIARVLLDTPQYQVRQIASYIVLRQIREFSGLNLPYLLSEREGR